ncbi:outer membrane receptor for ferrienterochelin and colicins [Dysgonomonas macrotermitis]|uniref:Outer membrane receptor for ferrienterochelin and colicins n=2 Tax=Dysgonomonas macrotermitis TaxID=1346286 RepID=A0A1M5FPI9_9BACT|nr:outer membrane receptor for ferrienterochelin and colicins [Dysgonomonas macrotermitis]
MVGFVLFVQNSLAQNIIKGVVKSEGKPLDFVSVSLPKLNMGTTTDSMGYFEIKKVPQGNYQLQVSSLGYKSQKQNITVKNGKEDTLYVELEPDDSSLAEVVVTGTMRPVSRLNSPISVEVVTPVLFHKNPSPSLFESIGMINGIKPQINCNVCNTGDIHINGMEGPYTMILIDGMPIVSALSTVYGLNGIPNSLIERVEVVKGPASSLYGSEAMGGIINVITKNPENAPLVSFDAFGTTWNEYNIDGSFKFNIGKKVTSLLGINYFIYNDKKDKNNDNFTDITIQNRISIFNKWNFKRDDGKIANIGARYVYEDRWGGEMNWNKSWRGSDSIYGESVYTNRVELFGAYQLPTAENIYTQYSYNWHEQDSWYGNTPYMAKQQVFFAQAYWDKPIGAKNNLLLGVSFRYNYYDDNTPATSSADGMKNKPNKTPLPGVFIQNEWNINDKNTLLVGYRYDYDKNHGSVHSPRFAYRLSPNTKNTIRASFGTGFRVVNLFTEDHAALTGAREVVIKEDLKPERSYNTNLNYVLKVNTDPLFLSFDLTGFYSYFTNKIVGDFDSDPTKIIYANLDGHAISQGASLNIDMVFNIPMKVSLGITYEDVYSKEKNDEGIMQRIQQLHAPKWSGTFTVDYDLPKDFSVNLTGNWTGPMRLPVQPNDYRPEYSPWFTLANIQLRKVFKGTGFEVYGGVKNIFNFKPKFSLIRSEDPFDKNVNDPINNPNGYTFDTSYNYAPLQGTKLFLGIRYNLW